MNKISEFVNIKHPSFNIVCGLAGCGKSMYLENMAEDMAKCGKKVLYISLEGNVDRLVRKATYVFCFPIGTYVSEIVKCIKGLENVGLIILDSIDLIGASEFTIGQEFMSLVKYCANNDITLCSSKQLAREANVNNEQLLTIPLGLNLIASSIIGLSLKKVNNLKAEMKISILKDRNRTDRSRPLSAKFNVDLKTRGIEC